MKPFETRTIELTESYDSKKSLFTCTTDNFETELSEEKVEELIKTCVEREVGMDFWFYTSDINRYQTGFGIRSFELVRPYKIREKILERINNCIETLKRRDNPRYDWDLADEECKELIAERGGVDITDKYGRTLLMDAVSRGDTYKIPALIKLGANVNAVNGKGRTALFLAFSEYDGQDTNSIVNYLIDAGADLSIRDTEGNTCIQRAASELDSARYEASDDDRIRD